MAKKKTTEEEIDNTKPKKASAKSAMDAIFKSSGLVVPPVSELEEDAKTYFIDTGSYTVNALICGSIYGGIPSDSVSAIAGEKATGKTWLTMNTCKNFLDANPDGVVFYYDTERAVKRYMITERSIPEDRFYIIRVNTIEEFRTHATKTVNAIMEQPEEKRVRMVMVLDSLGMISTLKELKEAGVDAEKATKDMTKAQLVRGVFRVLTIKLGEANIPLIVTAHVGEKIGARVSPGMPPPKEMGGGEGLKYAASTIIFLSKSGVYDEVTKTVTGNKLTAKLYKSRFTREGMKTITLLDHIHGLDRYFGLFDVAKQYGIVKKDGNGFRFPDGQFAYTKHVLENPEKFFTPENLAAIEEVVQGAYKYGSGKQILPVEESDNVDDIEVTE